MYNTVITTTRTPGYAGRRRIRSNLLGTTDSSPLPIVRHSQKQTVCHFDFKHLIPCMQTCSLPKRKLFCARTTIKRYKTGLLCYSKRSLQQAHQHVRSRCWKPESSPRQPLRLRSPNSRWQQCSSPQEEGRSRRRPRQGTRPLPGGQAVCQLDDCRPHRRVPQV